jgi:hypothetical protein
MEWPVLRFDGVIVDVQQIPAIQVERGGRVPKAQFTRRITGDIQQNGKSKSPTAVNSGNVVISSDSVSGSGLQSAEPGGVEREFFGESLYDILKEHPELKTLVLQQMLVARIETPKDSLAELRQQIALALVPFAGKTDIERAARANMKRFGSATNPYQAHMIPNNIPISEIIFFLIGQIAK